MKKFYNLTAWLIFFCVSEDQSASGSASCEQETVVEDVLYDCVICGQSTPSTAEKTIGLVVLLQASSGKIFSYILDSHEPCSRLRRNNI